jgi:membrane-associated phospholipid phosphatase
MHDHLAILCSKYLVFIEVLVGIAIAARLLPTKSHLVRRRWLVSVVAMFVISGILAVLSSFVIHDPRPFVSDGLHALYPHRANDGFPSHHSLLAAAMVGAVALLSTPLSAVMAVMAVGVDWGRVACNIHHTEDVIGGTVIVLISLVIGVAIARQVKEV